MPDCARRDAAAQSSPVCRALDLRADAVDVGRRHAVAGPDRPWLQPAAAADSDDYSRRDFGDRRSLPERGTPSAARAQAYGRSR